MMGPGLERTPSPSVPRASTGSRPISDLPSAWPKRKRDFVRALLDARDAGVSIAGYGAPAKGNTLLVTCGVRADLIRFTVDRSPHKQGRLLPGSRIPIWAPDRLREEKPQLIVILPWNLRDEIVGQLADCRAWGARFMVAMPEVEVF